MTLHVICSNPDSSCNRRTDGPFINNEPVRFARGDRARSKEQGARSYAQGDEPIRAALEDRERELDHELRLRLAEHREGSTPERLRLGLGWLERYGCQALGPYVRARFRQEDGRKRIGVRLAAMWSPRTARRCQLRDNPIDLGVRHVAANTAATSVP